MSEKNKERRKKKILCTVYSCNYFIKQDSMLDNKDFPHIEKLVIYIGPVVECNSVH